MWRIWQQALRLTSGAIICSVVYFATYDVKAQDVLVLPESGQQQTGAATPEPTASPPPSANESPAALPTDIGDLLYPQPQQPTGEKRYVTPVPPTTAVAGLPMYQKQLEMRVPEERPVPQEEMTIPQDRVVPGLLSPIKAKGLTTKAEDQELDTVILTYNYMKALDSDDPSLHNGFREFMIRHPDSGWTPAIASDLGLK